MGLTCLRSSKYASTYICLITRLLFLQNFILIRFFREKRLARGWASRFHLFKDTGGALSSMPHYFLHVIGFRLMAQRLY